MHLMHVAWPEHEEDLQIVCADHDGPQPQGSYEIATTATTRDGRPALLFSYTTGHTYSDVPLPDYTFWGLPYAKIAPWQRWLEELDNGSIPSRWDAKLDRMLWVGTTGVGNGKLGFSSHPLRARFARCGPAEFGERLAIRSVAKEDVDRLAWRCPPGGGPESRDPKCPPAGAMPERWISLKEQCAYRVIVHLPGVSDWLEHFKHQLSCGSLNIYVTEERAPTRRDPRKEGELQPPLTAPRFEHFDWWSPLLQPGVHYLHVTVARRRPAEVCAALKQALSELEATPGRAKCIAEAGARLARSLTMARVLDYTAGVLRGAAAVQRPEVARKHAESAHQNVVSKRNLLRHVSQSTRPWMEHTFMPWHVVRTNGTGTIAGARAAKSPSSVASRQLPKHSFSFKRR